MTLMLKLIQVKKFMKEKYKTKQFLAKSIVGTDTHFGQCARCLNQTGKRENMMIGAHCDIDATISVQSAGAIHIGDYTTIRFNSLVGGGGTHHNWKLCNHL